MQIFILILLNILIGTVFYLLINLKIEKSSSKFYEKKLREEMDEIIREFNLISDRNISILENRINIMKKLLERQGTLTNIDIVLKEELNSIENKIDNKNVNESSNKETLKSSEKNINNQNKNRQDFYHVEKKGLIDVLENALINLKQFFTKKDVDLNSKNVVLDKPNELIKKDYSSLEKNGEGLANLVKKESREWLVDDELTYDEINLKDSQSKDIFIKDKGDEDLSDVFRETSDKYKLICELYEKGYDMENISRYSGLPIGEIKLVLNLNLR